MDPKTVAVIVSIIALAWQINRSSVERHRAARLELFQSAIADHILRLLKELRNLHIDIIELAYSKESSSNGKELSDKVLAIKNGLLRQKFVALSRTVFAVQHHMHRVVIVDDVESILRTENVIDYITDAAVGEGPAMIGSAIDAIAGVLADGRAELDLSDLNEGFHEIDERLMRFIGVVKSQILTDNFVSLGQNKFMDRVVQISKRADKK
jgi:hypothetical protein